MAGNDDRQIILTESQFRLIIKETVHDTLTNIGIQDSAPIEMQKDFQLLREWRLSTEAVKRKGLLSFVGAVFAALTVLIVIGIKTYF